MDLNKSKIRLKSQEEIDKKLQEFSGREHLYSIALFDILGFSNFVQKNGTDTIMELYFDDVDKKKLDDAVKIARDSFKIIKSQVKIPKLIY